jgi:uncharacterized repeat protein (TIGR01451 family)
MTVTNPFPEGLQYLRSEPPAVVNGTRLVWTLGRLSEGQTHTVRTFYKTQRLGVVNNCAQVLTEEGLTAERCVTTQVTQPGLKVSITAPLSGAVGVPIPVQVTLSNPGSGSATNLVVVANFDEGLEFLDEQGKAVSSLRLRLPQLGAMETRNLEELRLMPRQAGRLSVRVEARADGNLSDKKEHTVLVQQPQMKVSVTGPKSRYVGQSAEWDLRVTNAGEVPLSNLTLRALLPPELSFRSATNAGQLQGNEVIWTLGTLQAREQRAVQLVTQGEKVTAATILRVLAAADGAKASDQATIQLLGVPAFEMKLGDEPGDPVPVGKRMTYQIAVKNTGSAPGPDVEMRVIIPEEMRLVPEGAKGPTAATVKGQVVTFAPVKTVAPGETLRWTIEVDAWKAGDVRFRAELRSPALEQPVVEQESTRITNDGTPKR